VAKARRFITDREQKSVPSETLILNKGRGAKEEKKRQERTGRRERPAPYKIVKGAFYQ